MKIAILIFAFLCLLAAELALRIREKKRFPPRKELSGDVSLYTREGKRLSMKDWGVKLAISPFTMYKNFPNQKRETFTVGSHPGRIGGTPRPLRLEREISCAPRLGLWTVA